MLLPQLLLAVAALGFAVVTVPASSYGQGSVAAEGESAAGAEPSALLKRYRSASRPSEAQQAFADIRRLSAHSAHAALLCGLLASQRNGLVHDQRMAVRCYEQAAAAGLAEAQHELGMLLIADEQRRAEGERLLEAASRSLPESVYQLALLRARRQPNAEASTRRVVATAAEAGYAPAQYDFARTLLREGRDDAAVRDWLEKAAAQAHADAAAELAFLLERAKREADIPRIVELLTRASDGGSVRAKHALGLRYLSANGVKRDTMRAFTLIRESAVGGDADAQYALAFMLGNGTGNASDDGAALAWLTRAAEAGHVRAMHGVGNYYANGWGVGKSMDVAYTWYCRAARQGNVESLALVRRAGRKDCQPSAAPEANADAPPSGGAPAPGR